MSSEVNSSGELSRSEILSILTTEYYNLQSGRSATISESTGRASLFLSSISGTLVALGFIAQTSKMGDTFYLFSLVMLPTLLFVGVVTYVRILETSMEDLNYARGLNRIRHYYMELLPQLKPYFVLSGNDDFSGIMRNMAIYKPRGQTLVSTTGLIAVLNSVLAGVIVSLAVSLLSGAPVLICGVIGLGVFFISVALHQNYSARKWAESNQYSEILFPSAK